MIATMSFHLGKPVLVMLAAALVGGIIVLARPTHTPSKMVMWVFAESHQRAYVGEPDVAGETPAEKYTRTTGNNIDVDLINARAEDVLLLSIFNSRGKGQRVPDAVEVEISKIGKFFRPPLADIGFLPLNDFLKNSGWYDQIVQARFAPYSKNGVIFGVPNDLHPTGILYRKDLFDEAGVTLADAKTWPQFRTACLTFRHYWKDHGKDRWPVGLSRTASDNVVIMLQQQHVNLVDDANHIFLNDPRVASTLRAYAEMVAGSDPIGTDFNPAPGMSYRDLQSGDVCAMLTPDWQISYLKKYVPDAAGKMALMPLPIFDSGDAPTASWGGTMMGIPRDCRDPQASWKIIEAFYLDHDAVNYRWQANEILPPIKKYWSDAIYQQGDPFFANSQNVNQMYIRLAEQLPVRYVTPFTLIAQQLLSDVLNKTVDRIDANQTKNLDRDIQNWLDQAASDLDRRIKFGSFE